MLSKKKAPHHLLSRQVLCLWSFKSTVLLQVTPTGKQTLPGMKQWRTHESGHSFTYVNFYPQMSLKQTQVLLTPPKNCFCNIPTPESSMELLVSTQQRKITPINYFSVKSSIGIQSSEEYSLAEDSGSYCREQAWFSSSLWSMMIKQNWGFTACNNPFLKWVSKLLRFPFCVRLC